MVTMQMIMTLCLVSWYLHWNLVLEFKYIFSWISPKLNLVWYCTSLQVDNWLLSSGGYTGSTRGSTFVHVEMGQPNIHLHFGRFALYYKSQIVSQFIANSCHWLLYSCAMLSHCHNIDNVLKCISNWSIKSWLW